MNQKASESADHRQNNLIRWLAIIGIVGQIVFWLAVFIVGYITKYDHVEGAISWMAAVGEPYAVVVRVGIVLATVSALAFAIALDRMYREAGRPWVGNLLIMLWGIFGIGVGVFPVGGAELWNTLHGVFGMVAFFAPLFGIPLVSWHLHKHEGWPGYRSVWTVVIITILVVGTSAILFAGDLFIEGQMQYKGLFQRANNGVLSGWVVYHSFKLYRLNQRQ